MKRYVYNPKKHQHVKRYIIKTCPDCGDEFECPSNWRKTLKCPDCAAITKEYIDIARKVTNKLLQSIEIPTHCERCGEQSEYIQAHHKIPLIKGGGPGLHNIEFLCIRCHGETHKGLLTGNDRI